MNTIIIFLFMFIILAVIRVPLAHSMLAAAIVCIIVSGKSLGIVASTAYSSIDVFAFLAIPGFIFAGDLMLHGRIAEIILDEVNKITGGVRSIIGDVAVILSMLFGTILGSATATVGLVGGMLCPKMESLGYRREESGALVAASGILGILVPPSIPGIMYAISSGQSIIEVWLSTVMPALLLGPLFIIVNTIRCRTKLVDTKEYQRYLESAKTASKRFSPRSIPAILTPFVIFVGIFGGVFTPTEASAVIVLYSMLIGWFFYKGLNKNNIFAITFQGAKNSASIVILIAFASVAGRFFTLIGLPNQLVNLIAEADISKTTMLILINLILIVMGMFMETNTSILILTPLLLPIINFYEINPIHFGAVLLLNLQMGMLTPPFAGNLFVACKVAKVSFNKIVPPILSYIAVIIPVLILTTFVPEFSLLLVNLMTK